MLGKEEFAVLLYETTPRSSQAVRNVADRSVAVVDAIDNRGSASFMNRHIRSSARSGRGWLSRSAIIVNSRSRTNSGRLCQSMKDRAERSAVMRLLISAA